MTIWAEPIGKQHKHGKYTRKGVAKLFAFAQTRPGWLGVIFLGALVHRDSTPVAPSCPRRIAAPFITSIARFHSLSPRRRSLTNRRSAAFTRRATRSASTLLLTIARVIRSPNPLRNFTQPPLRCALHISPKRVLFLRAHQIKL